MALAAVPLPIMQECGSGCSAVANYAGTRSPRLSCEKNKVTNFQNLLGCSPGMDAPGGQFDVREVWPMLGVDATVRWAPEAAAGTRSS